MILRACPPLRTAAAIAIAAAVAAAVVAAAVKVLDLTGEVYFFFIC